MKLTTIVQIAAGHKIEVFTYYIACESIRFFGSSFTRREKPSVKPSREIISVTSAVNDQSRFTLHIRRSNARVFLHGSRANALENMAEDRKICEVFGLKDSTSIKRKPCDLLLNQRAMFS